MLKDITIVMRPCHACTTTSHHIQIQLHKKEYEKKYMRCMRPQRYWKLHFHCSKKCYYAYFHCSENALQKSTNIINSTIKTNPSGMELVYRF